MPTSINTWEINITGTKNISNTNKKFCYHLSSIVMSLGNCFNVVVDVRTDFIL